MKKYLELAQNIEGLDQEIELVRAKIRVIAEDGNKAENNKIFLQAIDTLRRLLKTKDVLNKTDKQDLKEGLTAIIKEIGIPMGIDLNKTVFK